MLVENKLWLDMVLALGIGLLIGAERERSKVASSDKPSPDKPRPEKPFLDGDGFDKHPSKKSSHGIRSFTIASLLGALSMRLSVSVLIAAVLCVMVFAGLAYFKQQAEKPGITTEIALITTVILGGLATQNPALSAALGVCVAILLAAKAPIHGFVVHMVTKQELNDFLILAASTFIILPLVPDAWLGPFNAINPRNLWLIVILVMSISALSHLCLRWLGSRIGLPMTGLISGFISSIATVTAMAERARQRPEWLLEAVAGATLSSLATILQLVILLAAVHPPALLALALPLAFGGLTITLYGGVIAAKSFKNTQPHQPPSAQTFSIKSALLLASVIAVALMLSAALKAWLGQAGLISAAGIAGLADVHAPTIAVATLAATGKLATANTVMPILVAFTAKTTSKIVMAAISGSQHYAQQVIAGLVLQVAALWLGWWLSHAF